MSVKLNSVWFWVILITLILATAALSVGMLYPVDKDFTEKNIDAGIKYIKGYPISYCHVNICIQFIRMFSIKNLDTVARVLISVSVGGVILFIISGFQILCYVYHMAKIKYTYSANNKAKYSRSNDQNPDFPF